MYLVPTNIAQVAIGDKEMLDLLCFSVLIKGRYRSGVLKNVTIRKVMELMGVGAKRATRIIENSKTSTWFRWRKGSVIARRLLNTKHRTIAVVKRRGKKYYRIVDDNVCKVDVDKKTTRRTLIDQLRKLLLFRSIRGKMESFKRLRGVKDVDTLALTQKELSDAIGASRSTARRVLNVMEDEGLINIERHGVREVTERMLADYLTMFPRATWFRLNESLYVVYINRYGIQDKEYGHRVVHVIFNHDRRMTKCIKSGEVATIAERLLDYENM